jgi:pimeloyl-ACP methyl ester carboxylesterase
MRNHGDSFWNDDHSSAAMANDLAEVIAAEGMFAPRIGDTARQADVMGHSMGGKAAMTLALTQPDLVRRLVVADIAPIAYRHSHDGLIEAMQGMNLADLTSRSEADRRLAERVSDAGVRAFLLQSLELRDGPVRWKLNLDVLDTAMEAITGWQDPEGQPRYNSPTLFLYGKNSNYVLDEYRAHTRELFPQAQFIGIEDAGHWLHAEKPREVEAAIEAFLS